MGMLTINLQGSFGNGQAKFSAMDKGHAAAVAEAIEYLSRVEMPKAIENDHRCHADGMEPGKGFAGAGPIIKR
jgi:hypothetical protein